jgi:hypothetical protein
MASTTLLKRWKLEDAKARFSELVRQARESGLQLAAVHIFIWRYVCASLTKQMVEVFGFRRPLPDRQIGSLSYAHFFYISA